MTPLEYVFWTSIGMVFYAYAGYMAILGLLSFVKNNKPAKGDPGLPSVSMVLTVHNEVAVISEKIKNMLNLNYPFDLMEIIVVSDASTDGTDEIVRGYESDRFKFIPQPERRGKESCQMKAVEAAKGDIVVFTDASVFMPPDAVARLAGNFSDPNIGCVSSTDSAGSESAGSAGESLYVRYEMKLRELESRVGSLVGLSGSCFASRRRLCYGFSEGVPSDFVVMLNAVREGLRGLSDPGVRADYKTGTDPLKEFARKVRTVIRGMTGLWKNKDVLNPFRYGFFAVQLFSHKLCRWMVPVFLALALASNAILAQESPVYAILFAFHLAFYGVAVLGIVLLPVRRVSAFRAASFFVLVNASIAVAWWRFIGGERIHSWSPTRR